MWHVGVYYTDWTTFFARIILMHWVGSEQINNYLFVVHTCICFKYGLRQLGLGMSTSVKYDVEFLEFLV